MAHRASSKDPGGVPVPVFACTVRAPSANGGKNVTAVVAEKSPGGGLPGRRIRGGDTPKSQDAVQGVPPLDTKALVNQASNGSVFDTVKTGSPLMRLVASKGDPDGKAIVRVVNGVFTPVPHDKLKVLPQQRRPAGTPLRQVVEQQENRLGTIGHHSRKQAQPGKAERKRHVLLGGAGKNLALSVTRTSRVLMRQPQRMSVPAHKRTLQSGNLASREPIPRAHRMAKLGSGKRLNKVELSPSRDRLARANASAQG